MKYFLYVVLFAFCQSNTFLIGQDLAYVYNFQCDNTGSQGSFITTLSNGDVIFAGAYHGTMDLDPGTGVKSVKSATGTNGDVYIVTLDSTGAYKNSEVSNEPNIDYLRYLDSDPLDNIYRVYKYPSTGTIKIIKSHGNYRYTKIIRTPNYRDDEVNIVKIGVDKYENAYILGNTIRDFNVDGQDSIHLNGNKNNFIIKYDKQGIFQYSMILDPGSNNTNSIDIYDIDFDREGNVFFGGRIKGSPVFQSMAGDTTFLSESKTDVLFGKIDTIGRLIWSKSFGGNKAYSFRAINIGVDSLDNLIIATDQDATIGKYVYKTDTNGNQIWSIKIGRRGFGHRLHVLPNGDFYFMSRFYESADMDPNEEGYYPISSQYTQYYGHFVAKYKSNGSIIWGKRLYASSSGGGVGPFAVDKNENIYFGGTLSNWLNYDSPTGIKRIEALKAHLTSAFLIKWTPEKCLAGEKTDYYIKNGFQDDGNEDNPIVPFVPWYSSEIYKSSSYPNFQARWENSPNGKIINRAYIKIHNRGCANANNANLEIRYAVPPSDLSWPEGWDESSITIDTNNVKIAGLVSNISIPKLMRNDIWYGYPIFNELPDPRLFGETDLTINVLARIISEEDPMAQPESNNVISNVVYNNNIAWKIFNVIWW